MRIPTLAATLKAEIRRLAAREVERALKPLRKMQRQARIAKSTRVGRRELARIEKNIARLEARFSGTALRPKGRRGRAPLVSGPAIRALRARLRMTRQQFAGLIGVSAGSIFGWESGRTVPRGPSAQRVAEAKKLGFRAAQARVLALGGDKPLPRRPGARRKTMAGRAALGARSSGMSTATRRLASARGAASTGKPRSSSTALRKRASAAKTGRTRSRRA